MRDIQQSSLYIDINNTEHMLRIIFRVLAEKSNHRNTIDIILSSFKEAVNTYRLEKPGSAVKNKDRDVIINIIEKQLVLIFEELLKDENKHIGRLLEAIKILDTETNKQIAEGIKG